MRIIVEAKTAQRIERITPIGPSRYEVRVHAEPKEGKANTAIISALAKYFSVPRSRITLKMGATAKTKVFEVL